MPEAGLGAAGGGVMGKRGENGDGGIARFDERNGAGIIFKDVLRAMLSDASFRN